MSKNKKLPNQDQDSDSDFSLDDENNLETNVDVGFVDDEFDDLSKEEKFHAKLMLRSPFFPSKLGGKPAWLNYANMPNTASLKCASCQAQLAFLLQIYAPISESDKHPIENVDNSFHRVLYVFLCSEEKCTKRTLKVFRSQISRANDFYSYDAPPVYDDGLDPAKNCLVSFYSKLHENNLLNLCSICGLASTKKCAKCAFSFYCCQAHQVFDWTKANHREICGKYTDSSMNKFELFVNYENNNFEMSEQASNVFPEYEILIEPEVIEAKKDNKKAEYKYDEKKLTEDLEMNLNMDQDNELDNLKENETDKDFEKFKRITNNQSEQILRYERGGLPLWVTKCGKLNETSIPPCSHCGSKRVFEFQINPQLLNYLGLDEVKQLSNGIDWAGLYVYTCMKSCSGANTSYCEEFIYKQEFVS